MNKTPQLKLVLVNFWHFPVKTPHFGLISLAAYIRKKIPNIKIIIIEGINPYKKIIACQPDLVGFTSDTLVYKKTLQKAKQLRKKLKTPFILGGVHITALSESFDSVFDIGVLGEGEITMVELLKIFRKKHHFFINDLKKINGVIFFEKKKLIQTDKRKLIKNIDELPYPARDLIPMEDYYLKDQLNLFGVKRLATLMTSRGCPYRCIFCGSPVQWGSVRFHSPKYVVGEIKMLLEKYKIDGIMFWDDLFIIPEARIKKICQLIKNEGLDKKITYFGYARANLINEDICRLLKSINVKRLIFGFESGSEKILSYLKKKSVSLADNRKTVKLCRKYSIAVSSGFITGTPGETLEDLQKTYQFMKKYPLDNSQIYILTPYPGTETWQQAKKKGLVSKAMDFNKLFVQLPPLKLLDFLRKDKSSFIKNRVFLNKEHTNSIKYLRLIFKMQKLAFWQNLMFYLKLIPKDLSLILKILKVQLFAKFGSQKAGNKVNSICQMSAENSRD